MCIKDNTSSNNSSFNIDILNAPKQEIKIALINPEPLDLDNDSDDSNENEEECLNLTFNKLGKQLEEIDVFSSYSTRDSDDDAINNIKHELNNKNKFNLDNIHNNMNKVYTLMDLLNQKNEE